MDVHPDIASIFPRVGRNTMAVWALIAASGALLLVLGSLRVRATCLDVLGWLRDRTPRAWVAVGGIALVVICLGVALIAFVRLEGQHGEPMAFGAGISVWPSEILRMVVALLAVWCLVSIRRALDAMRHEFTALTGPPVDRTGDWSPRARPEGRGAAASAQFQGQRATRGTAP